LQQYKMAFLDRMAFVITARDFDADDDIAALAHVYTLCATYTIVVTQADRRVGEVTKGALTGEETAHARLSQNVSAVHRPGGRCARTA
jgi:hypothetical protein